MTEKYGSDATDRRVSEGLFQWRADYQTQFEHFMESLQAAQADYNQLAQQFQIAKSPYDWMLAWGAFTQCRLTHVEKALREAVDNSVNWKASIPRST